MASSITHEDGSQTASSWSEPTDSGTLEPSLLCQNVPLAIPRSAVPDTSLVSHSGVLCLFGGVLDDVAHVVDLRQSMLENLLEDEVWLRIEAAILQNKFSALAAFPPSSSFTSAFRLPSGVGVYGKPELRNQEKDFVRRGTLLALRCLRAARIFHELGRPWLLVARSDPCEISFALLDEAREVAQLPSVQMTSFQCPLRSRVLSPAVLITNMYVQIPADGSLSRQTQSRVFLRALTDSTLITRYLGPSPAQATDEVDLLRKRVSFTAQLRGYVPNPKTDKQRQDASALGGLRNTVKSIRRLHGHQVLGPGIAGLANKFLDACPLIERQIEDAISGSHPKKVDPRTLGPSEADLDLFRGLLGRALGTTDLTVPLWSSEAMERRSPQEESGA